MLSCIHLTTVLRSYFDRNCCALRFLLEDEVILEVSPSFSELLLNVVSLSESSFTELFSIVSSVFREVSIVSA